MSGQTRSIYVKFLNSKLTYNKMPILSNFVSGSQHVIYFQVTTTIENSINCVSKSDVITLTCFLGHCTDKNKDIALKFCIMLVVCKYLDNIHSGFLNILKVLDFIGNYFRKSKFCFFKGQIRKI